MQALIRQSYSWQTTGDNTIDQNLLKLLTSFVQKATKNFTTFSKVIFGVPLFSTKSLLRPHVKIFPETMVSVSTRMLNIRASHLSSRVSMKAAIKHSNELRVKALIFNPF
jgi:hypothetical protein